MPNHLPWTRPSAHLTAALSGWLLLSACDWLGELARGEEAAEGTEAPTEPSASVRDLDGPMEGVFEYRDKQGGLHFVDDLEKVPPEFRAKVRHPDGGALTILPATPIDDLLDKRKIDPRQYTPKGPAESPPRVRKHDQIILYTTSWCPHCVRARQHLERRGVRFVQKDVERDEAALREMLLKSGGSRGVPVVDVYGTVLRGFSPQSVDRALER